MARRAKTNIPAEYRMWVSEHLGKDTYRVCSNKLREEYFLYMEDEKGNQYLIMSGDSPVKFESYLEKQRSAYERNNPVQVV